MTEKRKHRLYLEILGIFALCFLISLVIFFFISLFTVAAVEEYCFLRDIPLSEDQLYQLDNTVFAGALVVSAIFFAVLFFMMFGQQLAYIRTITGGVDALSRGELEDPVPLIGKNELTELARSVNFLANSEREIKEKEKRLAMEKEELIRALSHDIRTPLTSLIAYTEILAQKKNASPEDLAQYFDLVGKKTAQIKHLTDILLDSGKRQPEDFEDASLLVLQLVDEFEEMLEGEFEISADTSALEPFRGCFDVREMRRIFDNLISNVQKYADPAYPVEISAAFGSEGLVITQKNAPKLLGEQSEGYRMGILSMRRIAQNYGGSVTVSKTDRNFEIILTFSDICGNL